MTTNEYINYIIGNDITYDRLEEQQKIEDNKLKKKTEFYNLLNTKINLPNTPSFSYIPYLSDFIFNRIKFNIVNCLKFAKISRFVANPYHAITFVFFALK